MPPPKSTVPRTLKAVNEDAETGNFRQTAKKGILPVHNSQMVKNFEKNQGRSQEVTQKVDCSFWA